MIGFRIFFVIDALIALVTVFFFILGLGDGTVSAYNMGIWLLLLCGVAIPMFGGWLLRQRGNLVGASVVLAVLAVPGGLIGLFFLLLISLGGDYK